MQHQYGCCSFGSALLQLLHSSTICSISARIFSIYFPVETKSAERSLFLRPKQMHSRIQTGQINIAVPPVSVRIVINAPSADEPIQTVRIWNSATAPNAPDISATALTISTIIPISNSTKTTKTSTKEHPFLRAGFAYTVMTRCRYDAGYGQ